MPSANTLFYKIYYEPSHLIMKCLILTQESLPQLATISSRKMQKASGGQRQKRLNRSIALRGNHVCNRETKRIVVFRSVLQHTPNVDKHYCGTCSIKLEQKGSWTSTRSVPARPTNLQHAIPTLLVVQFIQKALLVKRF